MDETTPAAEPTERSIGALPLVASVVMPTHARRESLVRVLRALAEQTVAPGSFEVLVICDGDVDGSVAACHALAPTLPYPLRVFEQPNQGPAAARNTGVAQARAPLIVFLDDDVVPLPDLLAVHLAAQQGQERLVTIGPLLPPPDFRLNAWGAWEEATLVRQYDAIVNQQQNVTSQQFYTGNASVLKHHIVAAGGFDATYRRAEDVELAMRLSDRGLRFTFLPEARAWHYVSRPFAAWLRMATAYGRADVAMARTDRSEVLVHVWWHFHQRNPVIRVASRLCAGRPTLIQWNVSLLGMVIQLADWARATRLATQVCSLVFNLQYYDGVASELGGNRVFRDLMRQPGKALWVNGQQPTHYLLQILATGPTT